MGETMPKNRLRLTRTLVLVGMMGAGKTAIGRALAARLRVEMCDSDAEIVDSARMSIAEIFERDGEAFFRDREREVIARLLEGAPCILSTGGGAWLSPENRQMISARAAVLWLEADLNLLWARVRRKTTRPLLHTENPRDTLADLLEQRTPSYAMAELKLTVNPGWSIAKTTDAVMARLIAADVVEIAE
ncbi:shikimate kinase [Rhodophyticola sp. CCM32]|uniref:shikimate kinase n=1 Tax=Rhodophyticola sp. CCM32 TaxID=2916397 RepID=UPI00107F82D5|nr:shikimate kinase [Rhodophyticola sp. CCM32]QBY00470.1 shikimate kinase [Rhodophyticola sp. CCM32]